LILESCISVGKKRKKRGVAARLSVRYLLGSSWALTVILMAQIDPSMSVTNVDSLGLLLKKSFVLVHKIALQAVSTRPQIYNRCIIWIVCFDLVIITRLVLRTIVVCHRERLRCMTFFYLGLYVFMGL
jgi:hypothetical protein